jgi:hypothetical protein
VKASGQPYEPNGEPRGYAVERSVEICCDVVVKGPVLTVEKPQNFQFS